MGIFALNVGFQVINSFKNKVMILNQILSQNALQIIPENLKFAKVTGSFLIIEVFLKSLFEI